MNNKTVIERLLPAPSIGGDMDGLLTVIGDTLDTAESRADDLLVETFPDTTTELFQQWLDAYGLSFDVGISDAEKRARLLAKINELGGNSIPYFALIAANLGMIVAINDSLVFKFGVNYFGDPFYPAEYVHAFEVTLAEQHLFQFKFGVDTFGDPFEHYDKRNSIEALFRRLKPAHTNVLFNYFNFDFETGDGSGWDQLYSDQITAALPRNGTYSAQLDGGVGTKYGVRSKPIIVVPGRSYTIDSWHNVTPYVAGTYNLALFQYYDYIGKNAINSSLLMQISAATAGWEQNTWTLTPAGGYPNIAIHPDARSFAVIRYWGSGATGSTAYMDDVNITIN